MSAIVCPVTSFSSCPIRAGEYGGVDGVMGWVAGGGVVEASCQKVWAMAVLQGCAKRLEAAAIQWHASTHAALVGAAASGPG